MVLSSVAVCDQWIARNARHEAPTPKRCSHALWITNGISLVIHRPSVAPRGVGRSTQTSGVRIDLSIIDIDGAECDVAVQANGIPAAGALQQALGCDGRPIVGTILGRPDSAPRGAGTTLDIVGGVDAGRFIQVRRGQCTLGRDPGCQLVLQDPDVSRVHATLTVTDSGAVLHDVGSTNGTSVDGVSVKAAGAVLGRGTVARIGDTFLGLADLGGAPASVRDGPPGYLLVNRCPRARVPHPPGPVPLPVAPDRAARQPMQWFAALLPALAGVGLAVALGSVQFLAFALLSPLALLATAGGDRLHWRRSSRRALRAYRHDLVRAQAHIASRLDDEARRRRSAQPDAAAVWRIARTPLDRLWERGRDDPDLLRVRLGLTSLPSELRTAAGANEAPAGQVHAVPLCADLGMGPLGIAGPRQVGLGVARWLLAQLVTQASPADVEIAVLLSDDAGSCWTWMRWLPHLRGRIATTAAEREQLCADLADLITARRRASAPQPSWLVLIVDRLCGLGDLPALATVLDAGPAARVTAVCLDDRESGLPAACRTVGTLAGETGSRVVLEGDLARSAVLDRVNEPWAERLARALAPLADACADPGSAIPDQCRLVELLGGKLPSATEVLADWRRGGGGANAVLGLSVDGPLTVDLERDGPHVLIAGTTGAGKSELLQTLVIGLALAYPPDKIGFVLVDYKGGSAFADCARLPHTSGLVTDLDDRLTRRALQSLDAELRRREQLFSDAGAADLAAYRASGPHRALARLVLVVDEFAALAAELPSFVQGLVGIAQRGRSLGVHLVLATQRPAGVVSQDIRANAALRIALRVTDAADSCDVIDGPEAAHLDRRMPGRALVRRGTSTVLTQVARVSAPAVPVLASDQVTITRLDRWRSMPPAAAPVDGRTELGLLVDTVIAAAARGGDAAVPRPWLPPLPSLLPNASLTGASVPGNMKHADSPTTLPLGLVDLPDEQRQTTVELDLAAGGSLLLAGGPRSGRSTGLVSLAITAATRLAPADLELYGIDGGGGALAPLARLPHAGGILGIDGDLSAVDMLLQRLSADIAARHSTTGTCQVARVLLVDGWEAFAAAAADWDAGSPIDRLLALLRDGAAGLTVVVTGGRAALAPRVAGQFANRLVLSVTDVGDWALAGLSPPAIRDSPPPGRALRVPDGAEVQLAVPADSAERGDLDRAIEDCAAQWRGAPAGSPIRVRPLPTRIGLAELPGAPDRWIIGVGGASAEPLSIDLFAGAGRLLVAGPPRSGRSSLLCSILVQAKQSGVEVIVAAPIRSLVRAAATELGIGVLGPGVAGVQVPRGRALLIVDDSESFADTAAGEAFVEWARGEGADLAVVAAARSADLTVTFRGIAADLRRGHCGVLLQPGPLDGELLGVRLPRTRYAQPPGRAVLVGDPAWGPAFAAGPLRIQVALP